MRRASLGNEETSYYSMITIHKKQVLDKVTHEQLSYVLLCLRGLLGFEIYDIGTHGNGRYFQLHFHVIVRHKYPKLYLNKHKDNFIKYYIHIVPLRNMEKAKHYIHNDDHNNIYKLENLLIENDYYYSTPKQTRSGICAHYG